MLGTLRNIVEQPRLPFWRVGRMISGNVLCKVAAGRGLDLYSSCALIPYGTLNELSLTERSGPVYPFFNIPGIP